MQRLIATLFVAASVLLTGPSAIAQSGKVVYYTGIGAPTAAALVKAFEAKYPNIKVDVIQGGSGTLWSRLKAEKARPQADVVWGDAPGFESFGLDQLKSYKIKDYDKYPASAIGPDDKYYHYTINIYTFLVNTKLMPIEQAPKSWKELADPQYKGKIVIANPALSGGAYFTFAQQLQLYGWDHMNKVIDNAFFVNATELVFTSVARGENAIGLTEESKAWERANEGFGVKVVYPAEGTAVNYASLGLINNSPNPENATLFYDFHLSREGAELNVSVRNRRSTRQDVSTPKGIPDWKDVPKLANYNEIKAMNEHAEFIKAFEVEFNKKRGR